MPEPPQPVQTHPIVYLRHQRSCLYAELIQTIEVRQRCWLRPLLLAVLDEVPTSSFDLSWDQIIVEVTYDLRDAADLLWPLGYFQPASDTELLPVLPQLCADKPHPSASPDQVTEQAHIARQQLAQFIQQVWKANPAPSNLECEIHELDG